jgi:hypothetical protein
LVTLERTTVADVIIRLNPRMFSGILGNKFEWNGVGELHILSGVQDKPINCRCKASRKKAAELSFAEKA